MTPATLDEPTINALASYAAAHDFLGDEEQRLVAAGRYQAAEEVHALALIAVRAWQNEIENPEPPERTYIMCSKPHCPVCGWTA